MTAKYKNYFTAISDAGGGKKNWPTNGRGGKQDTAPASAIMLAGSKGTLHAIIQTRTGTASVAWNVRNFGDTTTYFQFYAVANAQMAAYDLDIPITDGLMVECSGASAATPEFLVLFTPDP